MVTELMGRQHQTPPTYLDLRRGGNYCAYPDCGGDNLMLTREETNHWLNVISSVCLTFAVVGTFFATFAEVNLVHAVRFIGWNIVIHLVLEHFWRRTE